MPPHIVFGSPGLMLKPSSNKKMPLRALELGSPFRDGNFLKFATL